VTTPLTEEESVRLQALAVRLRELQVAAESDPAEQRRDKLRQEIARSLAEFPPDNRKRYLEFLLDGFAREDPAPAAPVPHTSDDLDRTPAPAANHSPEDCITAFLALAAGINEERRVALTKRLADAGFNWVDKDQLLVEVSDSFREALGLPSGQQPRLARMVQLTVALIELLNRLDHMALKTFTELAPRSSLGARPQEFRDAVANFLTGNSDSVEPQIRAISALVGGLMAAILGAGREFGRQYTERFSPSSIEDVVKGEGKVKLFGNEKALCWDKYKDLARDYATADLVDRRIRECFGAFAEKKASAAR
jgi:hypothetical protein